jgi:hypothetical protein
MYLRKPGCPTRAATIQFSQWQGTDDSFRGDKVASVIHKQHKDDLELESLGEWIVGSSNHPNSFIKFAQQKAEWVGWSNGLEGEDTDVLSVMSDIAAGKGLAVSDGSFKDKHGTASLIIEGSNGRCRVGTSVITPGDGDDQCAYRSEVAGILATIQLVNAMADYTATAAGHCTMGFDGKSALDQWFWNGRRSPTDIPHFDMVAAVRNEIAKSPIQWTKLYIPGHQIDPGRTQLLNNRYGLQASGAFGSTEKR